MFLYREYLPKAPLNKYIDRFWFNNCNDHEFVSRQHLVVPDNTVELVISDTDIRRTFAHDNSGTVIFSTHLSGLKTKPQLVSFDTIRFLGVRFKPGGLHKFTPITLRDTVDQTMDPADVFGKSFNTLIDKIFSTDSETVKIHLLEKYFIHQLHQFGLDIDPLFDRVLEKLDNTKGIIHFKKYAHELKVSTKSIERKFNYKLGMTPASYSRIVRFRNVLNDYFIYDSSRFPEIAYDNGYFDQTHFIKETRKFTGFTPLKYVNYCNSQFNIQKAMISSGIPAARNGC